VAESGNTFTAFLKSGGALVQSIIYLRHSREIKPMPCRATSKMYGTVSAERQKAMSGLEFVQGLADGTLPLNTMAETLGL